MKTKQKKKKYSVLGLEPKDIYRVGLQTHRDCMNQEDKLGEKFDFLNFLDVYSDHWISEWIGDFYLFSYEEILVAYELRLLP